MNTVAIVQARVGSTRLPAKVLRPIAGKSMLERVLSRLRRATRLDSVWVATTDMPEDDVLVQLSTDLGYPVFRGSVLDVLSRYLGAARLASAERIIRVTSDCPLIDPDVVDATIAGYETSGADYASNSLEPSFPRGLDVEVFSRELLELANKEATRDYERVHVTPFFYRNPQRFRIYTHRSEVDASHLRWTVDTEDDWALVSALYDRAKDDFVPWQRVLSIVSGEPSLASWNAHVRQKAIEEG